MAKDVLYRAEPTDVCDWDDEHGLPPYIIVWDTGFLPRSGCRTFCDEDCEGRYIDAYSGTW